MATIILKDKALTGNFEYNDGYIFHGAYNASEEGTLNNCNGSIEGEHGFVGTMTASRNMSGDLRLSLDVPIELMATLSAKAVACVNAIEAELAK